MDSQQASGTIVQIVINNKHKHGQGKGQASLVPHPVGASAAPVFGGLELGKDPLSCAYQTFPHGSLTIQSTMPAWTSSSRGLSVQRP